MFVGVALMALPAMAQTFGTQKAEQPNAVFQSTSTMMGSGSTYSANPTLNNDGTASYGASQSGPRRAKMEDPSIPSNPWSGGANDPNQGEPDPGPIGDALLPLLFMSLAFGMFVYFRRKRSAA